VANFLPLPQALANHFRPGAPVNLSLLLDRGMDQWSVPAMEADKPAFLKDFVARFQKEPSPLFARFHLRRAETLAALGAVSVDFYTQARLVVGLGLPNPIETAFLLDRLTGCPCLPGSSVKGLLRAAARLAAAGDLEELGEGARVFWSGGNLTRIFGPEIEAGVDPRLGEVIFYDAFPLTWPRLAVDVLTPHQSKYYQGEGVPADWNKPVPVPFLAVEKGTAYRFWMGPGGQGRESWETDLAQLRSLLGLALDVLGIGGKKAAGYGLFGTEKPSEPAKTPQLQSHAPPRQAPEEAKGWKEVELGWHNGSPAAFRGKDVATCRQEDLPPELLQALKAPKKKTKLLGTVEVRRFLGKEHRIVSVASWRRVDK
jgi:CRISPR type III-B/RAMP module RAMP protein Cmr6